jgi:glycosyltransferase involved in cell wall biosynthesis
MNAGIAATQGEFVAFLDADDEWLPGKLRKQLAVISSRPGMSFVSCGCIVAGPAGEIRRIDDIEPPPVPETEFWRPYLAASHVWKSCIVVRCSILRTVGPFDERLRVAEDQDMFIRLALAAAVGHVPEALARTHDTAGSLTKRYAASAAEFLLPMIHKHLAAQAHRLSRSERRQILGQRHAALGRQLYAAGARWQGLRHLATASLLGHQSLSNAWYLLVASGPAQLMKHMLRRR